MATDLTPAPPARAEEPKLSSLVGGIVEDGQKLIEQQFALLKHDVRRDVERAADTGKLFGLSVGLLSAGGLLLLFMLVHLLEWAARPNLELWACFAIVGGLVAAVGGALFVQARQKLASLNVVPEQTTQGIKENLQWTTNPR